MIFAMRKEKINKFFSQNPWIWIWWWLRCQVVFIMFVVVVFACCCCLFSENFNKQKTEKINHQPDFSLMKKRKNWKIKKFTNQIIEMIWLEKKIEKCKWNEELGTTETTTRKLLFLFHFNNKNSDERKKNDPGSSFLQTTTTCPLSFGLFSFFVFNNLSIIIIMFVPSSKHIIIGWLNWPLNLSRFWLFTKWWSKT